MSRRKFGRTTALGLFVGIVGAYHAYAANEQCPGPGGGQVFPFDKTTISFDSIPGQSTGGQRNIVNCVMILNAAHEYHIDWSDAGIDAYTIKGYLMSSRYLGDNPKIDISTAYIGVNRTKFTPGLGTEKTFFIKIKEAFETRFLGSVSIVGRGQPEPAREAKLQPVDLQFVTQLTEPGRAQLEFADLAAQGNINISFSLPEDVRKALAATDQQFRLSKSPTQNFVKDCRAFAA
jgi:hypothetical protein